MEENEKISEKIMSNWICKPENKLKLYPSEGLAKAIGNDLKKALDAKDKLLVEKEAEISKLGSENTNLLLEVKRLNDMINDHVSSPWFNVDSARYHELQAENARLKREILTLKPSFC